MWSRRRWVMLSLVAVLVSAAVIAGFQAGWCPDVVCGGDGSNSVDDRLTPEQDAWLDARDRQISIGFGDYPPYVFSADGATVDGYAAEYIRHVEEAIDVDIIVAGIHSSFAATLAAAEAGEMDVLPFVERTPERETHLVFTDTVLINQDHIFVTEAVGDIDGIDELAGSRVAAVEGYAVVDRFRQAYPEHDFTLVASELDGLLQLAAGDIDALLAGFDVVSYQIREAGVHGVRHVGPLRGVGVDELRFAVPREHAELRGILDATFDTITDDDVVAFRQQWIGFSPTSDGPPRALLIALGVAGAAGLIALLVLGWSASLRRLVRRRTEELEGEMVRHHRTERDRLRLFHSVEQAADVIVVADAANRISYVNPAIEALTQVDRSTMIGQPMWKCLVAVGTEPGGPRPRTSWNGVVRFAGIDFAASVAAVEHPDGDLVGTVATLRDTRVEQEQRDELVRAQSLASVGVLAAGVAHDFNNLLTPALLSAEMLSTYPPRELHDRLVERIITATERGRDLVDHLRDVQGLEDDRHPVDVGALAEEVVDLLTVSKPDDVSLVYEPPDGPVIVEMPSQRIHHALVNLVSNGLRAVGVGPGSVVVRVEPDRDPGGGKLVRVSVTDDGPSPSAETIKQAFEPYYAARAGPEGASLGLFVVRSTIEAAGGSVHLEPGPSGGLVATMVLPVSEAVVTIDGGAVRIDAPEAAQLLVVDDEQEVLEVIIAMLEFHGYACDQAESVPAARDLLSDQSFDVVISDLSMPGGNGEELAAWIEQHHPTTKVVILTGLSDTAIVAPHRHVLRKPISSEDLLAAVDGLLAGSASA